MRMRQYTLSRPPTIRDHTHLCFQYMRHHALWNDLFKMCCVFSIYAITCGSEAMYIR